MESYFQYIALKQMKKRLLLPLIVHGTLEYMKPLNVGLMFFNDEPQKFFPYSQIEVVDLRNGPEGDDMTERIFKGPIDSMIKSALTFIRNTVIEERIKAN